MVLTHVAIGGLSGPGLNKRLTLSNDASTVSGFTFPRIEVERKATSWAITSAANAALVDRSTDRTPATPVSWQYWKCKTDGPASIEDKSGGDRVTDGDDDTETASRMFRYMALTRLASFIAHRKSSSEDAAGRTEAPTDWYDAAVGVDSVNAVDEGDGKEEEGDNADPGEGEDGSMRPRDGVTTL